MVKEGEEGMEEQTSFPVACLFCSAVKARVGVCVCVCVRVKVCIKLCRI